MAEKFGIVVAIGLTFFGLMLIAAQDIGLNIGTGADQQDRTVLASQSFGQVGEAQSDIRTTRLGTFTIGEGRGDIQVYQDNRVELTNSLFSGNSVSFQYNATQPEYANISFEVLGKEGNGALYVESNGERVFEEQLVTSATENIQISGENLEPGVNNFEVGVTKGGFFSSTRYVIEDLRATVNDRKFSNYRDNFQMYDYELQEYGFVGTNLSFTLPVDTAVATEPIEIYLNDNKIFESTSVRSEQSIAVPREQADLHPGYNTIRFETDADARYKFENAQITVQYIGKTSPTVERLDFSMNQSVLDRVERENTNERISYNYQILSGNKEVYFELGSFNRTVTPVNGQNTLELPEGVFSRSNTLEIQSSGSFTLDDVQIISEVEE